MTGEASALSGKRGSAPLKTFIGALALAVIVGLWVLLFPRPRITSNESSAIASMRLLVRAEAQHKSVGGVYASLTQLSATAPACVDSRLGGGKKNGYCFLLTVGKPADSNWYATANASRIKCGNRDFFVDASGVIRYSANGPATSNDSPIE